MCSSDLIANRAVKRKLFTAENDRPMDKFYTSKKDIEAVNDAENKKMQKKFMCSTFITYVHVKICLHQEMKSGIKIV